ncbi:hypothetical protein [Bradyrhizobium sp. LVM 105]|uniref:hypothetical protein n=1 Tax=Bradyrhizobium sp. LVM 105 TaxID=2341115 RepID=UPI000F81074B|nr:hypothetical protein [Bradyrhizobium sp. LVM 105]
MLNTKSKAVLAEMLYNLAEASGDRDVLRSAKELMRAHGGRTANPNNHALVAEAQRRLATNAEQPTPKKEVEILRCVARDLSPYEDRNKCAERIRKHLRLAERKKNQRK